jgi:hypothetical protein
MLANSVAALADNHVRAFEAGGVSGWVGVAWAIYLAGCAFLVMITVASEPYMLLPAGPADQVERYARALRLDRFDRLAGGLGNCLDRLSDGLRNRLANGLTGELTTLAVVIAGRRRAHVRDAWLSDLERPRDPADEDVVVSATRKVIYSAGLVRAAVCYRINDVTVLWWRAVDGVLASRSWSRLVLVVPCAWALVMIVHRDGLYGLVVNAENLIAIGTASAGLVYGGRKARKVTVKPARQKQDQV